MAELGSDSKSKKKLKLKQKEKEVADLAAKLIEAAQAIEKLKEIVKGLVSRLDAADKTIKERDEQLAESIKLIDEYRDEKVLHEEQFSILKSDLELASRGFMSRIFGK